MSCDAFLGQSECLVPLSHGEKKLLCWMVKIIGSWRQLGSYWCYLFKVVNIALENLHTSLLGRKWSNIPNTHYTGKQMKVKWKIQQKKNWVLAWERNAFLIHMPHLCCPWSLKEGMIPRSLVRVQLQSHRGRAYCRSTYSASGPTPAQHKPQLLTVFIQKEQQRPICAEQRVGLSCRYISIFRGQKPVVVIEVRVTVRERKQRNRRSYNTWTRYNMTRQLHSHRGTCSRL